MTKISEEIRRYGTSGTFGDLYHHYSKETGEFFHRVPILAVKCMPDILYL